MPNKYEFIQETPKSQVEIASDFSGCVPKEFQGDPFGYFQREGVNVKDDEATREKVKDLPDWVSLDGTTIPVLAKKVRVDKAAVGESGDPFYEFKLMEMIHEVGLRAPRAIAKATHGNEHLIVMERLLGHRTTEAGKAKLRALGLTDDDFAALAGQIEPYITELKQQFEAAGFHREWRAKDMIYDIDIENKRILKVTPTDWERTRVDSARYEKYKAAQKEKSRE